MHTSNTSIVGFYGSPHDNIAFYGAMQHALFKGYSLDDITLSLKPAPGARNPEIHLHHLTLLGDVLGIHTRTGTAEISPRNRFKTTLEWLVSQEGTKHPMFEIDEVSSQLAATVAITVRPNLLRSVAHSFTLENLQRLTSPFGLPLSQISANTTDLRLTVDVHIPHKATSHATFPFPTWENSGHTTPIPRLNVDLKVCNLKVCNISWYQGVPQLLQALLDVVLSGAHSYNLQENIRDHLVLPFLNICALNRLYSHNSQWITGYSPESRPHHISYAIPFDSDRAWIARQNLRFLHTSLVVASCEEEQDAVSTLLSPQRTDAIPFFRDLTAQLSPTATYAQRFNRIRHTLRTATALQQRAVLDFNLQC